MTQETISYASHPDTKQSRIAKFFTDYFWFVLKNILGWLLILSAWPVGIAIPGPGGIPLFLIGFALITFPGKRKFAARLLRGRPLDLTITPFFLLKFALAVLLPVIVFWYEAAVVWLIDHPVELWFAYVGAMVGIYFLSHQGLRLGNLLIRGMPKTRRMTRPWLRRKGIHLLPPRRRRRTGHRMPDGVHQTVIDDAHGDDQEIIQFHPRHHDRARRLWNFTRRYLRLALSLALVGFILVMMVRPLHARWDDVRERVLASPVTDLLLPGLTFSLIFAAFLFIFRALIWREMLAAFGHRIPLAPAVRIWSHSELARYVPGSIFQLVGRAMLLRPYGVSGSISTTVQVLELTVFLLANVLLAVSCLIWFGFKSLTGPAEAWLYLAIALVPALCLLLHPRVYYALVNRILTRIGRPAIVQRLGGKLLIAMLAWNVLGLLIQSAGVYLVIAAPLDLQPAKWWVVAGAYALAWLAGFLAFFSSAGMGVREAVFPAVMVLTLPPAIRATFADTSGQPHTGELWATMIFLGFLLRLWTIVGELLLACLAALFDRRALFTPQPAASSPT